MPAPADHTAAPDTAPGSAPGPNSALRALLAESGWTQEAFARTLARLGAEAGRHLRYDRTSVAHWLRGSRPAPAVQRLMAEALSRRLGRPVTVPELGMEGCGGPGPRRPPARAGTNAAAMVDAAATPLDVLSALTMPVVGPPRPQEPVPYRLPVPRVVTAASGTGAAPQGKPPLPRRFPAEDGAELASVRAHVHFFAEQADRHGGGHIRAPLAAYTARLTRRLRAAADGPQHRELLVGAARLSYLLARVYADEQRHGLAQCAFRAADGLSAEAGDPEGVALARRALSSQAHQLGHHAYSLDLARGACAAAPATAEPSARAFLYAGLAVAEASLAGGQAPALDALRHAERELERADALGGEPVGGYQDAALRYQAAAVRARLGDPQGAIDELQASLRSRPLAERRARALSRAELAELLLACGRLEEACAAWRGFLEDCALVRSGRARRARARIPVLLRAYRREPCVQALLARAGGMDGVNRGAGHPQPGR